MHLHFLKPPPATTFSNFPQSQYVKCCGASSTYSLFPFRLNGAENFYSRYEGLMSEFFSMFYSLLYIRMALVHLLLFVIDFEVKEYVIQSCRVTVDSSIELKWILACLLFTCQIEGVVQNKENLNSQLATSSKQKIM